MEVKVSQVETIQKAQLSWFGHMKRMAEKRPPKKIIIWADAKRTEKRGKTESNPDLIHI